MTTYQILEQVQLKRIKMPDAKFVVMSIENLKTLENECMKITKSTDWNKTLCGLPVIVANMSDEFVVVGE